jgi:hypothetical protein
MTVTITDIDTGTTPGDDTGDTAYVAGGVINTNFANLKAAVDSFFGTIHIATVIDQDYILSYDMPYPGTITTLRTKTQSGTCTVTAKINTTALGGTANSASSTATEQAHASANTFIKGDTLKVTISANSSAIDIEITFIGTS